MDFHPVSYAKAHPWTIGAIVVGGGLAFIVLSGWFRGGSGGTTVVAGSSGPSDAQLAADNNVALANIQAGAANNQTNAELQATTIQAQLSQSVAALQEALGIHQIDAGQAVSMAQLSAQLSANQDNNSTSVALNTNNNATTVALGAQNTGVIQALIDALTPKPATPAPTTPNGVSVWDQYLTDYPDVTKAYPQYVANEATWATSGFHIGDTIEQFAADHYLITGASEGRILEPNGPASTVIPSSSTSAAA